MRHHHRNRGFGLVVVVLMLLGMSLAAGALILNVTLSFNERAWNVTETKLKELAFALSSTNVGNFNLSGRHYEQDVGALPTTLSDLITKPGAVAACAMSMPNQATSGWCGPYWTDAFQNDASFNDGWGRTIVYSSGARTLTSYGPNGVAGGGDDIVQNF
jgi:hypothetical protein